MANNTNKMTIRRLVKGQVDKIKRVRGWRQMLVDAIVEICGIAGTKIDPNKINLLRVNQNKVLSKEFGKVPTRMNDSRLANNQSLLLFQYNSYMYYIVFDHNNLKIMLSKTNQFVVNREEHEIHLKGLNKPFICIQANRYGDLDPECWKGIPYVDKLVVCYTDDGV